MLASIIFQRLAYRRHGLVRAFHREMRGAERALPAALVPVGRAVLYRFPRLCWRFCRLAAALLRSDSAGRFPQ
jgi:hypothetical protein